MVPFCLLQSSSELIGANFRRYRSKFKVDSDRHLKIWYFFIGISQFVIRKYLVNTFKCQIGACINIRAPTIELYQVLYFTKRFITWSLAKHLVRTRLGEPSILLWISEVMFFLHKRINLQMTFANFYKGSVYSHGTADISSWRPSK